MWRVKERNTGKNGSQTLQQGTSWTSICLFSYLSFSLVFFFFLSPLSASVVFVFINYVFLLILCPWKCRFCLVFGKKKPDEESAELRVLRCATEFVAPSRVLVLNKLYTHATVGSVTGMSH